MDWTDEAFVLAARRHGEGAAVVQLLTREHGRHAGLVHGGGSASKRSLVEPGNRVQAAWRGRLAEHLGRVTLEVERSYAATLMDDPKRLSALAAACAVAEVALPEREPHPAMFHATQALLDSLADTGDDVWPAIYIRWELGLLGELGFGLDLSACAATGQTDDLVFVSPRTGRAVSREAGVPYQDKLLALPAFLTPSQGAEISVTPTDFLDGVRLTGYFLARHVFDPLNRPLPGARDRLADLLNDLSPSE
ncbi:MAG: DNA repair protein RecO (recombination protein O) [Alphaproteobacteria bacterium]|jgi:DNA repair protein RecO (recombination protein O)